MIGSSFPPADLRSRVLSLVDGFLREGDRVVVAFSGGADSTFLLWMAYHLAKLRGIYPVAAYLNHGQRPDASREEAHVRRVLESWGYPRVLGSLRKKVERNPEHELRRIRYRFLEGVRRRFGARWVLTAHTADDMVETLLLQLARGGGGWMTGIPLARRRVLRPLLLITRGEIREALEDAGFPWYEDPSNRDPRFFRNRIRQVMDLFPSPLPATRQALLRQRFLRALEGRGGLALTRAMRPTFPGSLRLDRTVLAGYDKAQIALALSSRFPQMGRAFWFAWVAEKGAGHGQHGGYDLWMDAREVWVGRARALGSREVKPGRHVFPEANLVLDLRPDTRGVIPEGALEIRGVQRGDRMGEVRVATLLKARGIPRWAWPLWPVVARGQDVVWMLGVESRYRGPGYTVEVNKHEPEDFGIPDLTGSPS